MNWIENINLKLMNEDKKIVLNNNHNGRVIFIEDNECEILDSNYINDKKNKISWRHIYSYLDNNTIEIVNRMVYQSIMKEKILNIHYHISFSNYLFDMIRIVEDIYDCKISHLDSRSERERKQKIIKEESWEFVELEVRDNTLEHKTTFIRDNKNSQLGYSYNFNCKFRKSNGEICNKYGSSKIELEKDYFSYLMGNSIECCGIHYNQYNRMNKHKKNEKVKDIFRDINLVMKNGVMCKC
jgi:hypothetical protein